MKKIISMILAFVMLLGTVTVGVPEKGTGFGLNAFAESYPVDGEDVASDADIVSGADTSVANGASGNCVWYIDTDGTLYIEPAVGDYGVLDSGSEASSWGWYDYRDEISRVVVQPGVEINGSAAYMFADLVNCTEMDLSGLDTFNSSNMESMFSGCSSLQELDLSSFDTSGVGNMRWMFEGCSSLKELDLSSFDTSSVQNMMKMFSSCSSLEELDVSGFDTSAVTDMRHTFSYCERLNGLDLSSWETYNVKNFSSMFRDCISLSYLDISGFDTSSAVPSEDDGLLGMNFMFTGCSVLHEITVGTGWAPSIGYMLPEDANTFNVDNNVLYYLPCEGWCVDAVTVYDADNGDEFDLALDEYPGLYPGFTGNKTATISFSREENGSVSDGDITVVNGFSGDCVWYIDTDGTLYIEPADGDFGELDSSSDATSWGWYDYRDEISRVVVLPGVSANGSAAYMFADMVNCTEMDLSGLETSNSTDMMSMFSGCSSLQEHDLSGFDTSDVGSMRWMFDDCKSLTSLDLSNFVTYNVTNMGAMFGRCSNLIEINVSGWDTSGVTDMGSMFMECESLISLNLSGFDTSSVTDMYGMFSGCRSLTTLDLSGFVTSGVESMYEMFCYCESLTSLDLSSFDTSSVTDMGCMFSYCDSLTSLDLSSFDTSAVDIMHGIFDGCGSITTLTVGTGWKASDDYYIADDANTFNVIDGNLYYYPHGECTVESVTIHDGKSDISVNLKKYPESYPDFTGDKTATIIFANDAVAGTASGTCGDCVWYIDDDGVLTIEPADGKSGVLANGYDASDWGWHDYCYDITRVVVQPGVAANEMAVGLFAYLYDCTEMDLSGLDTSNVINMREMFFKCGSLTTLDFSGFDTSNVTDMSEMFYGCSSLTTLDFSGFDTSNVTDMSSMFQYCNNLTSLDLSGWDTSGVTGMSRMFSSCNSLTSLDLSSFDTSCVENMNGMFAVCSSMTTLDLSGFDTSSVTDMCGMFDNCESLRSLSLSSFDTSSVTDMCGMFNGCSSLTSLDVSGFDTSCVENMSNMFYNCESLTSLDLSNFDTSNVADMSWMFCYCNSLTELDLSGFDTSGVGNMGSMFADCHSLERLDISSFDTSCAKDMTEMFYGDGKLNTLIVGTGWVPCNYYYMPDGANAFNVVDGELIYRPYGGCYVVSVTIHDGNEDTSVDLEKYPGSCPDFTGKKTATIVFAEPGENDPVRGTCGECVWVIDMDGVLTIAPADGKSGTLASGSSRESWGWSYYRDRIKEVVVSPGVKGSGQMSGMFSNLYMCSQIDLSGLETTGVTDMSEMFEYCFDVTELDVSGLDTSSVTDMANMFQGCENLTSLDVSGFDTSNVLSMMGMFRDCTSLTELDLSGFDTSAVEDMCYMFQRCHSLTGLDLSTFDTSSVVDMQGMFRSCFSLKALNLSGWDTSCVIEMSEMFRYCHALTSLDLSSFDTSGVERFYAMFADCDNLTSLDLSSFDTSNAESCYKDRGMIDMMENCPKLSELIVGTGWLPSAGYSMPVNSNSFNVVKERLYYQPCGIYKVGSVTIHDGKSDISVDLEKYPEYYPDFTGDKTATIIFSKPEGIIDGGTCGECVWNIDLDGVLTIEPADGKSGVLDDMGAYWGKYYCDEITKVVVKPGVKGGKTLGSLFYNLYNCTEMDLSGLDTTGVVDMSDMFGFCSSLTTLDVSGFDTSSVMYMGSMFSNCKNLTSLDVSGFDTSSVTNMGGMFEGCKNLTTLDVSGFDTSSVTNMYGMFRECGSLTELDLSGFDTSSVKEMGEMFSGCENLTTLDVSGFDTSSVTNMYRMFNGCENLTTLDVSGFDTSSVMHMGSMFSNCKNLTTLVVSGFDTSSVTNMYWMFNGCENLTSLDVSGWDTSSVMDMDYMFNYCNNLTSLNVSGWDTSSVMYMNYMFNDCHNLTSLDVSGWDTSSVTNMCWMFCRCYKLTALDVSGWDTSSVTNMEAMFRICHSLTSLDVSGFDTSSVTNMHGMFNYCINLTTLDVSGIDTSNVTDMVWMFEGCYKLTALDVSGFDTSSVTSMLGMFNGCGELTALDVSGWDTSSVMSMSSMFNGCGELTALDVSGWDTSNVTNMDSMFRGCKNLTALDLSGWDTSSVMYINYMFNDCHNLTTLDLSSFDTSKVEEFYGLFSGCERLASLDLSSFDTSSANEYYDSGMSSMFYNCPRLRVISVGTGWVPSVDYAMSEYTNAFNVVNGELSYRAYGDCYVESVTIHDGDSDIAVDLEQYPETWPGFTGEKTATIVFFDPDAEMEIGKDGVSGVVGDGLTWTLTGDGVLTISGEGALYYENGRAPWINYFRSIRSIIVGEGVTSICESAFNGYDNVTEITLSDGLESIGFNAFSETAITELTVPGTVMEFGNYVQYCPKLKKVVLEEGVCSISNQVFFGCDSIESLVIPSTVNDIITSWILDCGSADFADVVISADNPDYRCENGMIIESHDGQEYKMLHSFLPGVTGTVTVPADVEAIFSGPFVNNGITELVIHKDVQKILHPDSLCVPVKVDAGNRYYSSDDSGVLFNKDKTILLGAPEVFAESTYVVPDTVREIASGAFRNCSLEEVVLPDSLIAIKERAFIESDITSLTLPANLKYIEDYAFAYCYNLSTLEILCDAEYLSDEAFYYCKNIYSVTGSGTLPNYRFLNRSSYVRERADEEFVVYDGALLAYNGNSSTVTVPDGVTSIACFENSYGSTNYDVTSVTLPSSVKAIEPGAFAYMNNLEQINFSGSLERLGYDAFCDTSWLNNQTSDMVVFGNAIVAYNGDDEEIVIPDNITAIGAHAFACNENLRKVTLGSNVKTIGDDAFEGCYNLNDVVFNDGLEFIGQSAFSTVNVLTFDLPDSVRVIESYAMNNAGFTGTGLKYIGSGNFRSYQFFILPDDIECIGDELFSDDYPSVGTMVHTESSYVKEFAELYHGVTIISDDTGFLLGSDADKPVYGKLDADGILTVTRDAGQNHIDDSGLLCLYYVTGAYISNDVTELPQMVLCSFENVESIEFETPADISAIPRYAFGACGIRSISVPTGVTHIAERAFSECRELTSIYLPSTLQTIELYAFDSCNQLSDVYFAGTEEEWNRIVIDEANDNLLNATIHFGRYKTDETTGVELIAYEDEDADYDDASLVVKLMYNDSEVGGKVGEVLADLDEFRLYDISLVSNGASVQPSGLITVMLPVFDGYDPEVHRVHHIDDDGNVEDMNAVENDDHIVFETTHFSYYVVASGLADDEPEENDRVPGDINGDGRIALLDSTILRRYLAGWTGVTINESNADVNNDGRVTLLDSTILRRYLAGWTGVELG